MILYLPFYIKRKPFSFCWQYIGQYTALCNAVTVNSCIFLDSLGLRSNSEPFVGIDMEVICLIRNELQLQEDVMILLFIRLLRFECIYIYIYNNSTLYFHSKTFFKPVSVASKHLLRPSLYLCPKQLCDV